MDKTYFKDKKIVIVGAGKTGVSAANFLSDKCKEVILNDKKKLDAETLQLHEKVKVMDGGHKKEIFDTADFIVISPGVNIKNLPVKNSDNVISDIEVFSYFNDSKIIAITGTNGKTTTTFLTGEILKKKYNVFVGGNIGTPVFEMFSDVNYEYDYAVLELSSFQLENIKKFTPDIAVILNITPDHLDRYETFNDYAAAKLNILKNTDKNKIAVLNKNSKILSGIKIKGKKIYFDTDKLIGNNKLYINYADKNIILEIDKIKLTGKHFYEDIYVAGLIGLITSVAAANIEETIYNFKGLEHRLELVSEKNGVKYYNDSKSTTISSTCRAVESFTVPVILILGGIHKGEDFEIFKKYKNIKKIICFGDAKATILKTLKKLSPVSVNNLGEAVKIAAEISDKGDVVLFSPACSSFDMFASYIERGKKFKELVA